MLDASGDIASSFEASDKLLADHWAPVFRVRPIDRELLETWFEDMRCDWQDAPLPSHQLTWQVAPPLRFGVGHGEQFCEQICSSS